MPLQLTQRQANVLLDFLKEKLQFEFGPNEQFNFYQDLAESTVFFEWRTGPCILGANAYIHVRRESVNVVYHRRDRTPERNRLIFEVNEELYHMVQTFFVENNEDVL